ARHGEPGARLPGGAGARRLPPRRRRPLLRRPLHPRGGRPRRAGRRSALARRIREPPHARDADGARGPADGAAGRPPQVVGGRGAMPEFPDITVYIEALERRILGRPVERIELRSPFVLRTVEPPITEAEGRTVAALRRLGKRIVLDLGDGLFLAIHL